MLACSLALAALLALAPFQSFAAKPLSTGYCDSPGASAHDTRYGFEALEFENGGDFNSAFGAYTLFYNSGSYNTAAGYESLSGNMSGYYDTASGLEALYSNDSGFQNAALGFQALYSNTGGSDNTAAGAGALYKNTTGTDNTSSGWNALYNNTTGVANTAAGAASVVSNITGSSNTATGYGALNGSTTGSDNTATGDGALLVASTASDNTAEGFGALNGDTSGADNTALGYLAGVTGASGDANRSGSNDTFIGYDSGPGTSTQLTNATAIGANATVSQSNALTLGGIGTNAVNVGIGTDTPDSTLTVVGTVESTSGGFKFPDGTVQTSAASGGIAPGPAGTYMRSDGTAWHASNILAGDLPAGSANYIQNTGSQQSSANFNISGSGTIGGTLVAATAGIGTSGAPNSLLQVGSTSSSYGKYMQLPEVTSSSNPPVADCNTTSLAGRLVLQDKGGKLTLWGCSATTGKWVMVK